ncbi:MAG TPA: hypothetical protein VFU23_07040 [Gemmatimonadales bacterium]|nr:hypothetical protein [Gemmatimonadales bacterium]
MNRYWLRIALGALLVFVIGTAAMAAVRKGKAEVRNFLATAGSRIPLQLANLKFRFEGRNVGSVTGIDIQRNSPADQGRVTVRVAMADSHDLDAVRDCSLTADDLSHLEQGTGFRCATASELSAGDMVETGRIIFEPGTVSRPLYLLRGDVSKWSRSDIRSLDASMNTEPHGGVRARGSFDIGNQSGPGKGSFTLQADSQGAVISVKDDAGRSLLDFRADQGGVNLNLHDRRGRHLIKLLADSLGAALKVHP